MNKKTILHKIILIFILIIMPIQVQASENKIIFECDKTNVLPGEEISCEIKGETPNKSVSSLSAKFNVTENLTLSNFEIDSSWEGDGDDGNIQLYTDENKSSVFNIASFKIKVSNNITSGATESININQIKFYDEKYTVFEDNIEDVVLKINILSTINTLSNIKISNLKLEPSFDSNTLEYYAETKEETITIEATATDSKSKITGDIGEKTLKQGQNKFKINVTSESGDIRTYAITVVKLSDAESSDNTLKSLKINNESINLIKDVYEYTYELKENLTEVTIAAELNDSKAMFVEGFEPKTIKITTSKTEIVLKVKAENESIQTYKIIITKQDSETENPDEEREEQEKPSLPENKPNEDIDNPKTGSITIYITSGILLISIITIIYYSNYYKKKNK